MKISGFVRARIRLLLLLVWAATAGLLPSQELGIDAPSQYRLYLKILTFNRAFQSRSGDHLTIGVLYVKASRGSRQARDDFAGAIASGPADFEGLPIVAVPVEYGHGEEIREALSAKSVDVLYVTPIDPFDLGPVVAACRAARVATFTGVPEYVRAGLSVSFRRQGPRAEIFINRRNARAEGSDFSARLLDMVTIIDELPAGETR